MPDRLIHAMDKATVLSDTLTLLFWAGEGISGPKGVAVARGGIMAQERLDLLRTTINAHAAH